MPWGKTVPDLSRTYYFKHIGEHIEGKANRKNDDSLPECMDGGKCRGVDQPENKYTGIKGIDQKAGQGDPGKISFGKRSQQLRFTSL